MSEQVVEAINDLTRVIIAINGNFGTKSDAVRRLNELSIPPSRIAAILAMKTTDVSSVLAKEKKKTRKETDGNV